MNRRQSSNQTRSIIVEINGKCIALTTQLESEETIRILEACLNKLKDKTSQKEVPIGKEK